MSRSKRKGKGGFLLGTVAGVAAGAVGGTVLLGRSAASEEQRPADGASPRDAEAHGADHAGGELPTSAGTALESVKAAPAAASGAVRSALDAVKARWQEAIAEGKAAAAERETELRQQYERDMQQAHLPKELREPQRAADEQERRG